MTVGFTQADLANLKAALVSGALRVQIGDRLVIYRSQTEIIEAIRIANAELNGPDRPDATNIRARYKTRPDFEGVPNDIDDMDTGDDSDPDSDYNR